MIKLKDILKRDYTAEKIFGIWVLFLILLLFIGENNSSNDVVQPDQELADKIEINITEQE